MMMIMTIITIIYTVLCTVPQYQQQNCCHTIFVTRMSTGTQAEIHVTSYIQV